MSAFAVLPAMLLASAPAIAGVITVDDDGGADFTDLPAAVAAAAPGDTLLVQPGGYSAFTIEGKPLTVLGVVAGQVVVQGTSRVLDIPAEARAVLCRLDVEVPRDATQLWPWPYPAALALRFCTGA